jgi:hypothetical protein
VLFFVMADRSFGRFRQASTRLDTPPFSHRHHPVSAIALFWGTDITKMPCSWRLCVTMFTEELPWLKGRDLELVMGEALGAWWGWDGAA